MGSEPMNVHVTNYVSCLCKQETMQKVQGYHAALGLPLQLRSQCNLNCFVNLKRLIRPNNEGF